jgi:hypothetical protein
LNATGLRGKSPLRETGFCKPRISILQEIYRSITIEPKQLAGARKNGTPGGASSALLLA